MPNVIYIIDTGQHRSVLISIRQRFRTGELIHGNSKHLSVKSRKEKEKKEKEKKSGPYRGTARDTVY